MPHPNTGDQNSEKPKAPVSPTQNPTSGGSSPNGGEETIRDTESTSQQKRKNKPRVISIDKIPKLDIVEGDEANKIARNANSISKWSVVVNAIILLITGTLAIISLMQAKSANSAAITANKTLIADTLYNNKVYKQSRIDAKANDNREDGRDKRAGNLYRLQKTNDSTQIASLQETQKEFDIENRPLIQVLDFKFDTLLSGHKVKISFDFINSGRQPVKVFINKFAIDYEKTDKFTPVNKPYWINGFLNSYLSGNSTSHSFWKSKDTVDKAGVYMIASGKVFTYVFGSLKFENTATGQTGKYNYNYQMAYNDAGFGVNGITDTIIYDKPKKKK